MRTSEAGFIMWTIGVAILLLLGFEPTDLVPMTLQAVLASFPGYGVRQSCTD